MTRTLGLSVSAVTFAFCLLLAAPGLTWMDGGELALAAGAMGVAHPPGEPAYLVFAKLAALLPVGDLPFRLTLLSAATVALAAGLLASIVEQATRIALAGLVAGLLLGLAPATVLQGVRPELYGLTLACGLLSVRCLQLGGRRGVALAVLPLCVAGAVHHAMLVAALPGLALLATGRGRGSFRAGLACAVLLVIPALLQFAWLPLRSITDPAIDFGSPRSWDRIVYTVSAAGYGRSFQVTGSQVVDNLFAHLRMFRADLGLGALALALFALPSLWRGRKRHVLAGLLLIGVGVLPTVLQGLFKESNPDARGYLLGSYAVLCAAAGFGAQRLMVRVRRSAMPAAPWVGFLLIFGLALPPLTASLRSADHSGRFLPHRIGSALLDGAAPGSVILTGGDSWVFPPLYLRYWEGRRPDVSVIPLHMLEPGTLAGYAARGAPVPAALEADEIAGLAASPTPLSSEMLLAALLEGGRISRVVHVNEVWLPPELLARRRPAGLLYRLDSMFPDDGEAEERLWTETLEPALADPRYSDDDFGQGVLGRRYGARGAFERSAGHLERTGEAWRRGSRLDLDDSAIIQLMRYRFDQGQVRPSDPALASGVRRAQVALVEGRLDDATAAVAGVLSADPFDHTASLLAERLYSLGYHAAPGVAGPGAGP